MSLVRFEDVYKIYRINSVEFPALGGISFSVEKGEFLSIAGPSGSGKTTVLNIIGCLDQPSQGSVYLNDVDISSKKGVELANIRRFTIGFVFQTFNLIPILTAFENVEFPLILKGDMGHKQRQSLVEEILIEVGLKDYFAPQTLRNERRTATAGGCSPGPGQKTPIDSGRRTHGQSGFQNRKRDFGVDAGVESENQRHLHIFHP
jgi:ABC-type lipoprotein export system ATPase subunit